ncbi:unnamed protein product, partial [Hapterophycus canaliculatus]
EREREASGFLEPRTKSPALPLSLVSALGEQGTVSPPTSPQRPPRGPASLSPSPSRVGRGGTSGSSLAGLPLPPMSGARQRLGALGNLPPVGGRGLPSLTLPFGTKGSLADGENEGVGRITVGDNAGDGFNTSAQAEDPSTSGRTSSSRSLPSSAVLFGVPGARSPTADSPQAPDTPKLIGNLGFRGEGSKKSDSTGDAGDDVGSSGLSMLEQGKEDEGEVALRARLGLGEDGGADEDQDSGRGNDVIADSAVSSTFSAPGSPKQHQGQEEENAGRISATGFIGEVDGTEKKVDASGSTEGGGGGDYFGDSGEEISDEDILEEVSSVDEDISFEQESAGSGRGDGVGGSDDDYFS